MAESRMREFMSAAPRAIVLDDARKALAMAAEALTAAGFDVSECETVDQFFEVWQPGMFDVLVADWDLTTGQKGDEVLEKVRERDWDVPFVLISGRLEEARERTPVLGNLLESGSARFVERGEDGFEKICTEAISLIARRDLALLRMILKLRVAALEGQTVATSSGEMPVHELLAELVRDPISSDDSDGPIADLIAARLTRE